MPEAADRDRPASGGRPDVVLTLPGRGRLFIDAKFPLDDFQRAGAAATDKERRKRHP